MPKLPATERRLHLLAAALTIGLGAALLAGCGGSDDAPQGTAASTAQTTASQPPATTAPATTTQSAPTRTVIVYFADKDAQNLVEESRPTSATGSDLRAALVELANGPAAGRPELKALPDGTAIVGTNVQGGEALVNLSAEFVQGYPPGGAAAEFAVLAPLVFTATAVKGVQRVRITVDGQAPSPAGSQFDWTRAFTRADFPDVTGSTP